MKLWLLIAIVFLIALPIILAVPVKVSPEAYSFQYDGSDMTLKFKLCHDYGITMNIPLVTEITTETLEDMKKLKINAPYQAITKTCKDLKIKITTDKGFVEQNITIKLKVLTNNYKAPSEGMTYSNVDLVKNQSIVKVEDIKILDNADLNYTNATISVTRPPGGGFKFGTFSLIMVILVIVIIGFVIYQLYQWGLIGGGKQLQEGYY